MIDTNIIYSGYLIKSPPIDHVRHAPKFLTSLFCVSAFDVNEPSSKSQVSHKKKHRSNQLTFKSKTWFYRLHEYNDDFGVNHKLCYYKNEKTTQPKGEIDLSQVTSIIKNPERRHCPNEFVIRSVHKNKTREYYLSTHDPREMDVWVNHLTKICGLVEDGSGGQSSHGSRTQHSESTNDVRSGRTGATRGTADYRNFTSQSSDLNTLSWGKPLSSQTSFNPLPQHLQNGTPRSCNRRTPSFQSHRHQTLASPVETMKAKTLSVCNSNGMQRKDDTRRIPSSVSANPFGTGEYIFFPPQSVLQQAGGHDREYYNISPNGVDLSAHCKESSSSPTKSHNFQFGESKRLVTSMNVDHSDYFYSNSFSVPTSPIASAQEKYVSPCFSHITTASTPDNRETERNYYNLLTPETSPLSQNVSKGSDDGIVVTPNSTIVDSRDVKETFGVIKLDRVMSDCSDIALPQRKVSGYVSSSSSSSTCDISSNDEDEKDDCISSLNGESVTSKSSNVTHAIACRNYSLRESGVSSHMMDKNLTHSSRNFSHNNVVHSPSSNASRSTVHYHSTQSNSQIIRHLPNSETALFQQPTMSSVSSTTSFSTATPFLVTNSSASNLSTPSDIIYVSISAEATGALASLLLDKCL